MIAAHKMYLELLYGKISFFAIAKLKEEFLRHDINPSILADDCDGCTTSIHFNLPCCHKLPINEPISVTVIPRRWRLHPEGKIIFIIQGVFISVTIMIFSSDLGQTLFPFLIFLYYNYSILSIYSIPIQVYVYSLTQ